MSKKALFPLPAQYPQTSPYGYRTNPIDGKSQFHNGLDLAAPTGTPIKTPADGIVHNVWFDTASGNAIQILHENDMISGYAHLSKQLVQKGQKVKQGQIIGEIGSTGASTGPHLHLTLRNKTTGEILNPSQYFKYA